MSGIADPTPNPTIDTARLPTLLNRVRLPTVARLWQAIAETCDRESWPGAKTLATPLERDRRTGAMTNRPAPPNRTSGAETRKRH